MKDKEIIYIFDQNVNVVIDGLSKMADRPYQDILTLLKDRGNGNNLLKCVSCGGPSRNDFCGFCLEEE